MNAAMMTNQATAFRIMVPVARCNVLPRPITAAQPALRSLHVSLLQAHDPWLPLIYLGAGGLARPGRERESKKEHAVEPVV